MKIAFWTNNNFNTTYTYELLRYLAKKNGHKETGIQDADIVGISLTSHYEIDELRKARKKIGNKKIIVGGHASNAPASLLRYADFVNLGAGFDFFEKVGNVKDIEKQDFIVSRDKKEGGLNPSFNRSSILRKTTISLQFMACKV